MYLINMGLGAAYTWASLAVGSVYGASSLNWVEE